MNTIGSSRPHHKTRPGISLKTSDEPKMQYPRPHKRNMTLTCHGSQTIRCPHPDYYLVTNLISVVYGPHSGPPKGETRGMSKEWCCREYWFLEIDNCLRVTRSINIVAYMITRVLSFGHKTWGYRCGLVFATTWEGFSTIIYFGHEELKQKG